MEREGEGGIGRQLEAIADLRLTAGDWGLEAPVGPEAKAKLVEALGAVAAESAGGGLSFRLVPGLPGLRSELHPHR